MAQKLGHGLDVIDRNARAQTKLIDDLLDVITHDRTGKTVAIQRATLPLAAVVQNVIEGARPMADARSLQLSLDIESDQLAWSTGDSDRLRQAIVNLVSNAIKFTPTGGRVMVGVRRVGAGGSDNRDRHRRGYHARLLAVRVRPLPVKLTARRTRAHGGLGLGLTIVRHIVELHGAAASLPSLVPAKAWDRRSP